MTSKYIFGYDNWKKFYSSLSFENKKKTWIFVETSDNKTIYLRDYKDWLSFQEYVDRNSLIINSIGLRYRSNYISTKTNDCDGIYLTKSLKGEFGGPTRNCFTIGKIIGKEVQKTMWITPELIEDNSYTDEIENCFEEAIVYYGKHK